MEEIMDRSVWGAANPRGRYADRGNDQGAIVHHTAGTFVEPETGRPGPKWYRLIAQGRASIAVRRAVAAHESGKRKVAEREMAAMRAIQSSHFARGWTDIGYHAVIFPSGRIYAGRPRTALGAHATGANHQTGISFAGNFDRDRPTERAIRAFWDLVKVWDIWGIRGHYQVNATACPGRYVKQALDLDPGPSR